MTELEDPIGCGANRGGCGCLGLWDCVHNDRLQRATQALADVANYGQGCVAAREQGRAPCASVCQCREEAVVVLRAIFPEELR